MCTVRANYSSPPTHGARIIASVLNSPQLRQSWADELAGMRERIQAMRTAIHAGLLPKAGQRDISRFLTQRGMFSYTGLSAGQVDRLRDQYGVYLLRSGRMCVAGLNAGNVNAVADAVAQVIATTPN
jgi:aromatic-amino-acid transaminase